MRFFKGETGAMLSRNSFKRCPDFRKGNQNTVWDMQSEFGITFIFFCPSLNYIVAYENAILLMYFSIRLILFMTQTRRTYQNPLKCERTNVAYSYYDFE